MYNRTDAKCQIFLGSLLDSDQFHPKNLVASHDWKKYLQKLKAT